MGSRIAAHLANAGFPVDLLDIVLPGQPARNAAALAGIESAAKQKPVAFMTEGDAGATIATTTDDVGLPKAPCYTVRDLWSHTDGTTTGPVTSGPLAPRGVALLRITATCK